MDAADLARVLAALEAGDLRSRRAAAVLEELPAEKAVALLAELLSRADLRRGPESVALEGALLALHARVGEPRRKALLRAAEAAHLVEVEALLARSQPARDFDHDREEWVDKEIRGRTLGERRQLARRHDRDLLARLAADPDPTVIRHVLQNPRCTEREVLLAASRRPQKVEVLEEVFRSRKWASNRRVRRALALNPYAPPSLAIAALALLTAPDLREVARDLAVATEVRVHARRMLGARKPGAA